QKHVASPFHRTVKQICIRGPKLYDRQVEGSIYDQLPTGSPSSSSLTLSPRPGVRVVRMPASELVTAISAVLRVTMTEVFKTQRNNRGLIVAASWTIAANETSDPTVSWTLIVKPAAWQMSRCRRAFVRPPAGEILSPIPSATS